MSATGGSASSSSSSTSWPRSTPGGTSSCRWSTPAWIERARKSGALAALDRVGLGRPGRASARRALRRPAAAGGRGPGAGHRPGSDPGRRADRQPRLGVGRATCSVCCDELHHGGRTIVLITHEADVADAAERTMQDPGRPDLRRRDRPNGSRSPHERASRRSGPGSKAVVTHRLRSGLTVLGIMIGIAAVILTVGLGEGAQQQVSSADHRPRDPTS